MAAVAVEFKVRLCDMLHFDLKLEGQVVYLLSSVPELGAWETSMQVGTVVDAA